MIVARQPTDSVTLRLPMPPSVNALWRPVRRRDGRSGMVSTAKYTAWQKDAGWQLKLQNPGRVAGDYVIDISVCKAETRCDLTNLEKSVSDLLQCHQVIDNDRFCRGAQLRWGADAGIVVTVTRAVE